MIVCYIIDLNNEKYKIFFQLTKWGELLCVIYSIVSLLVVFKAKLNYCRINQNATKLEWLSAVLMEMATALSFLITLLYYTILKPKWLYFSIQLHLVSSILMVLNLVIVEVEFNFLRTWCLLAVFSLFYVAVNFSYWYTTGKLVYDAMDWSNNLQFCTILTIAVPLAVMPLVTGLGWVIYRIRMLLFGILIKKKIMP